MRAFSMKTIVKGFAKDQPLEGRIFKSPEITVSVNAPAQGKMIENDMVTVFDRDAIRTRSIRLVFITEANAKIPCDDMTAVFKPNVSVRKGDSFVGCRLPGNGQVRHVLDLDILFQPDRSAEIKYDGARSFDRFDAFPE